MRKYLFSGSVLSAAFGIVGVLRNTQRGPRDWRTVLLWVAWGATLAAAIGTVAIDAKQAELEED
ncbi:MAG TPA: hypothetical protein VGI56_04280 [Galbitalea sp.]